MENKRGTKLFGGMSEEKDILEIDILLNPEEINHQYMYKFSLVLHKNSNE